MTDNNKSESAHKFRVLSGFFGLAIIAIAAFVAWWIWTFPRLAAGAVVVFVVVYGFGWFLERIGVMTQ